MKIPFWPDFKGYRNIELGLSRVIELLKRLDNPHKKLPPTIHIAGTNGKGSTLTFLRGIFNENGYKTHVYTSPHLVNFNERIVIADKEISDEFLNKCLAKCKEKAEMEPKIPLTFFEGITVAAFLAFSLKKADVLLLETGMGGRLDATNVLNKVLCSIITPISFDHTDFLGKTLPKIAFEKAGIIKKNCPVIITKQKTSALKALENQAFEKKSKTFIFAKDFRVERIKEGFLFEGFNKKIHCPIPSLIGDHQIENAATAMAAALIQKKFKIDIEKTKLALTKAKWQARLQKIEEGKFFKILPKNYELYLDGSHNLQGATTIEKFLSSQKNKKIFVIFSMLQDKDCEGFLRKISTKIDQLVTVTIAEEPKSRKAHDIKKIADDFKIKSVAAENFDDAFKKILLKKTKEDSIILICGSLYLAGSFLECNYHLEQKEKVLQ
ncbi:MAG: bifunctional folylpolyglutamate synthase/dihydrofolate synthase [Rickettsiales bacterium]|nr:bifunctional folylpolyglutamate synthase/dihydrofolate synthase [Rickettsiales bacterium]